MSQQHHDPGMAEHDAASCPRGMTYAASGVDIEAGDLMVGLIQTMMRSTHGPRVIDRPGGFAGLVRLDFNEQLFRRNYREPVLVACTDGVGSKVKLACRLGVYDTVGIDCVAMCINDLIVEGAEPLLFLDYLGVNHLDPRTAAQIVSGVADGCRQARAALIGGETAELPDLYAPGDFDLAGFAVGVLELDRAVDSSRVEAGDVVIGLASTGLHSNGFSLVRRIVADRGLDLDRIHQELDPEQPLGRVLLTPTRIYSRPIVRLLRRYKVKRIISGMAHITGGGLPGNICRALPPDLDAVINTNVWQVPRVFQFLQKHGNVDTTEMFHVFNMGIGYVLIVRPAFASSVIKQLTRLGETPYRLGEIVHGSGEVVLK